MNAIRRDEDLDNLHSIYVDQWDWEKVIRKEDRNLDYLKSIVRAIVSAVCATEMNLHAMFPPLFGLPLHTPEVTFITTQELEDLFPDLTPKERENVFVKEHGTTFLMQIGDKLRSGKPHDGRAPDYDDWELNGDILFWNHTLECSYELSSMGIRVSPESLDRQLREAGYPTPLAEGLGKAVCACCSLAAPTSVRYKPVYGMNRPAVLVPKQEFLCCNLIFYYNNMTKGLSQNTD